MVKLDLLDKKIMYELDLNARLGASQLSRKVKRSKETVNFRIKKLLENQYLKGFYTVFNSSKLGWYYYKTYIKFKNLTPEKEKRLFEYIQKQKNVAYLGEVEGYFDCIFLNMVKSSKDMTNFMDPFMKKYGEFVQEKEIHVVLAAHRLNNKFLYKGTSNKDFNYEQDLGNYKLDEIDKKILRLISSNSRMSLIDIADKVKVDAKVVQYRLKKLERDKIILGYVSSPNFDKLGLQFTQINISLRDPQFRSKIINYFNSTSKCLFVLEVLGKYDLSVEVHVKDNSELREIIDGFREKFVDSYNDYDVSTINKEYVMVWSPFS